MLFALAILYTVILLDYVKTKDAYSLKKYIAILSAFVTMFSLIYCGEYFNRYVEFFEEVIRFNSFRIGEARKVMSFNFRYENITSIEASYLPLFGVWKIKVSGKGFAYPIPISFCFNKYGELCEKLCDLVKEHNPDVYIDGRIVNFIERKKKHERN